MIRLDGRVAIVTGAGQGLGRAHALLLSARGAKVVVNDIGAALDGGASDNGGDSLRPAERVVAEIAAAGGEAVASFDDISRPEGGVALIARAMERFGSADILINNAGILQQKDFFAITAEEFDRIFAVNVRGTFLMAQAFMRQMRNNAQGGSVINIASVGGQLGGPLGVHYAASKAAVIGLTRSLARIGAPDIRVNCISPGIVETEMVAEELASPAGKAKIAQTLVGRAGYPEEIGECAAFLCSDGARYITGQTINVNGGLYLG